MHVHLRQCSDLKSNWYIYDLAFSSLPLLICSYDCSGRLLWSWADAADRGGGLSVHQLIYDAIGLCATISATAIITMHAKGALSDLQAQEDESLVPSEKDDLCGVHSAEIF